MLSFAATLASCQYDDEELWNKVNSLDDRVTAVEGSLNSLNQTIPSLQTIVEAMENRTYISSVTTTSDGYKIDFSDGKSTTITNGENAPVIGINKDADGKYYWTQSFNGTEEWLVDEGGNKMPVAGKDAVTPQLKINANGCWTVSYDNGATFTEVLDETGKPVSAVGTEGEKGDSFFSNVTIENGRLVLTMLDGEEIEIPFDKAAAIGVSDSKAGATPNVKEENSNLVLPQPQFYMEEGSNNDVLCMSLTGIQTPDTEEWMKLYGTGSTEQNIWAEIDGKPKAITVTNSGELARVASRADFAATKAKADVVFLVDNSGSMSEEANQVAEEIISWSQTLSQVMDVQFGCVGAAESGIINGAIDITSVENLHAYLNRSGISGTSRTRGFEDTELQTTAQSYGDPNAECGGIMLHFADEHFTFRESANRIYVHFTDEPNQAGNYDWSVESVNRESEHYNWGATQGTIHTIFSDLNNYKPDTYNWNTPNNEDPRLFSTYTGGTSMTVNSSFAGVTLDGLEVTGAITNSYVIRFNVTEDMLTGKHTVTIVIQSKDGKYQARITYKDVEFA